MAMSTFFKILARILVVCYLATSSIAATHALPMTANISGPDGPSEMTTLYSASDDQQQDQSMAQTMAQTMPCHQGLSLSADGANTAALCKIFCAAIGHAILSLELVETSSSFSHNYPHSKAISLVSTQLNVEQQPPK